MASHQQSDVVQQVAKQLQDFSILASMAFWGSPRFEALKRASDQCDLHVFQAELRKALDNEKDFPLPEDLLHVFLDGIEFYLEATNPRGHILHLAARDFYLKQASINAGKLAH